ncbi:cohesin domain-containing protein [Natrinema longum]|uniref:Cellulosome anchor protein n=1 Tax=Natrinema longum TaxID=370324 RepID=A0A8A2UA25_9EURY|nr:cohesin domain-containing protein [Natrinema longum]MBZ6493370.1 cellulosome anchor protein [Natrinema longum]QSW85282.1 cellulosome anchor protein [Natrinema longum]
MAGGHDDDDASFDRTSGTVFAAVVITSIAVLCAASMSLVGTAVAIDQVAILSPDRATVDATPGETIELDVTLRSRGGHGGEGVEAVTVIAQYHPDYLEITDVDRGPWLEGTETEVEASETIAHEQGTAILEQRREPTAGGTTGDGRIATVTLRVADDAPAGTTTVSLDESAVDLTGDWPIAVVDESATVAIDGGDEPLEPFDHPDADEIDREPEASSAGADPTDPDEEPSETDGSDPVSGVTIAVTVAVVGLAVLLLAAVRDGPRG